MLFTEFVPFVLGVFISFLEYRRKIWQIIYSDIGGFVQKGENCG